MRLRHIGSNMTELQINGNYILFSYETPVAGWDDEGAFKTDVSYSTTTSRHINKYLEKGVGRIVTQEYINSLTQ